VALSPTEPPASPANRRRETRVPARVEVRFADAVHAARVLHAYSLNFSLGGLCLRSRRAYAVGRRLALSLVVGSECLPLDAVVAWVRPAEGAVGLRFVDVAGELQQRLAAVMHTVERQVS
jgi:uncharacterized protein (TIGR02266 family)